MIKSRIEGGGRTNFTIWGLCLAPLIRDALATMQLLPVVTRDKGSPKLLLKRPDVVTVPVVLKGEATPPWVQY